MPRGKRIASGNFRILRKPWHLKDGHPLPIQVVLIIPVPIHSHPVRNSGQHEKEKRNRDHLFPEGCHKNSNNANENGPANGSTNDIQNKRTGKLVSGASGIHQDWSSQDIKRPNTRGWKREVGGVSVSKFLGPFWKNSKASFIESWYFSEEKLSDLASDSSDLKSSISLLRIMRNFSLSKVIFNRKSYPSMRKRNLSTVLDSGPNMKKTNLGNLFCQNLPSADSLI